ncbi:MAG: hypothetical protein H6564_21425 [Lewinellaceae bacterium]|nr:hypothetical protein [Lewinellaceae bacterium]
MQQNKLIKLLAALDKEEVRAFDKYIRALYGKYDLAMALFRYLKAKHPALDGPALRKETVLRKVLPGVADNNEKRLLNESSRLYKWLEEFLMLEKLRERDNPTRERLMVEVFKERQLSHLFYLKVQAAVNAFEQKPTADIWAIADALYMQHLWYYYTDPNEGLHTQGRNILQGLMETADSLFMAAKLQYGAELVNRGNLLQETDTPRLWQEVMHEIGQRPENHSLLLQAFFLAVQLLEKKGLPQYQALDAFFSEHHHAFSPEARQILHGYLINHAARRIKENDYAWADALFKLYEFEMSNQISFEQGLVSSIRFLNIVNLACHLKKLDWAEAFVEKWHGHLRPSPDDETYKVATALILFERKAFGSVRKLLSSLRSLDPFLESRMRTLLIMAMVEEGEDADAVLQHCSNFKEYLGRNKVMGRDTAGGFKNFVLALMAYMRDSVEPEKLAEEVRAQQPIYCKTWLLQKIGAGEVAP